MRAGQSPVDSLITWAVTSDWTYPDRYERPLSSGVGVSRKWFTPLRGAALISLRRCIPMADLCSSRSAVRTARTLGCTATRRESVAFSLGSRLVCYGRSRMMDGCSTALSTSQASTPTFLPAQPTCRSSPLPCRHSETNCHPARRLRSVISPISGNDCRHGVESKQPANRPG